MSAHDWLISAEALAGRLDAPRLSILDCRFSLADTAAGERAYAEGHIPGANYAHLDRDLSGEIVAGRTGRHPLPDRVAFARRIGEFGITPDTTVVVYDDAAGAVAARAWWMLLWLGHRRVRLLDGGLNAWRSAGLPISTEAAVVRATHYAPAAELVTVLDTAAIVAASGSGAPLLIDARETERFLGEAEPIDPIAGRIPGAISLPYTGNLDATGRFLAPARLRERYAVLANGPAVCYCGSGVTAAHNILAAMLAGYTPPKLYGGSFSAWIADGTRPVATGPD